MVDEIKCAFCGQNFRPTALDEKGKCEFCRRKYPDAESPDDIKKKSNEEKEHESKLVNIVAKQVDDILSNYGILKTCICGQLYYKRSPAQKSCGKCEAIETKQEK